MLVRVCVGLLLLSSTVAWSQVDVSDTEAPNASTDETPMRTPPPVSSEPYSTTFTSETQSNTLRTGLMFSTAYSDNVAGGNTASPLSDVSYSIWPTLALDATTTRMHWALNYSPGFTIYQRISALNQGNQNVALDLGYRLTPHVNLNLQEFFQKTSNLLNQPNPLSSTSVSGSLSGPSVAVIAPVVEQLHNTASAQLTYQFRGDGMMGVTGTLGNLEYPNSAESSGLYNSRSVTASAFYSRRFRERYYVGASYQYMDLAADQAGVHTATLVTPQRTQTYIQTVFVFCTIYLSPTWSLSLSGGPQHYEALQAPLPASQSWSPMLMASLGWQGRRTSVAASYSQSVTGGGGLAGTYHANSADVSGRWQLSRAWSTGLSASYSLYKTVDPSLFSSNSGGHMISGTVSFQRPLGERLALQIGYTRLWQNYQGIAALSTVPGTNRAFVSISYQFVRPLKR